MGFLSGLGRRGNGQLDVDQELLRSIAMDQGGGESSLAPPYTTPGPAMSETPISEDEIASAGKHITGPRPEDIQMSRTPSTGEQRAAELLIDQAPTSEEAGRAKMMSSMGAFGKGDSGTGEWGFEGGLGVARTLTDGMHGPAPTEPIAGRSMAPRSMFGYQSDPSTDIEFAMAGEPEASPDRKLLQTIAANQGGSPDEAMAWERSEMAPEMEREMQSDGYYAQPKHSLQENLATLQERLSASEPSGPQSLEEYAMALEELGLPEDEIAALLQKMEMEQLQLEEPTAAPTSTDSFAAPNEAGNSIYPPVGGDASDLSPEERLRLMGKR